MKTQNFNVRIFAITLSLLAFVNCVYAQAPSAIPYQAVARNASGNLIANQNISLRFSIHNGTAGDTVVYQETQSDTTNALGLFNANIGQGSVIIGTFSGINWATGAKFMQVEIDVTGGSSYVDIGTQQMMSVPYALYSASSGSSGSSQWTTNVNDIYNSNTGKVGIGTSTPEFKLSLNNDGGILAKGTVGSGSALTTSGAGAKMIWYPKKASFRVGSVDGAEWNDVNIGNYSIALGNATLASGNYSTAMGDHTTASGVGSTAIGYQTTASGQVSIAMGTFVNTNSKYGAFAFGDGSTSAPMSSSTDHEFSARFAGGYRLFSNAGTTAAKGLFFIGGKAGIGTSTPEFKLSLDNDGGILSKGSYGSGDTLTTSGGGTRLIWYPRKAAFRAGTIYGTEWNDANIGNYSAAMGLNSIASGISSIAFGGYTTASGDKSIAMGELSIASGEYSTAFGSFTTASGLESTAMGTSTVASGQASTAMGMGCIASNFTCTAMGNVSTASGSTSTAIGFSTTASGFGSVAMGTYTTASGQNTTALGSYVSTNSYLGSFVIGDYDYSSWSVMNSSRNNEFSARFEGGYRLFSNDDLTTGVTLAPGGGSWTSVSDKNKKENFKQINTEEILQKVGAMPLTNWNYKTQTVSQRHIGCMAQDFYAAFHLDGESDTTINSLDIDGINMAAIQALKARTDELKVAVSEIASLKAEVTAMKNEWNQMKAILDTNKIKTAVASTSTIK